MSYLYIFNKPIIKVGLSICGFKIVKKEVINNNGRKDTVLVLKHRKTGADVLYVLNNDSHRFFGISFFVPVLDKSGVAHVLEHSVLSSSRKYKDNELFFNLLKVSPATFLNAFTEDGQICYLFQTINNKDYLNLMGVYLDTSLFPELSKQDFKKEGWRLEADERGNLNYNGVVFNEMKTAYSGPDYYWYFDSLKALFPELEFESGGKPNHIVNLKYEDLLNFHKNTHNPSNSFTFLYGRGNIREELSLLNENFREFKKVDPLRLNFANNSVNSLVKKVSTYPAGKGEDSSYMTFSYVMENAGDLIIDSKMKALKFLFAGYEDAPLKKEILEKGLATDVSIEFDSAKDKIVIFIVFEGVKKENENNVELAFSDVLEHIAKFGFGEKSEATAKSIQKYNIKNENRFEFNSEKISQIYSLYLFGTDYEKILNRQKIYDEFEKVVSEKDFWKNFVENIFLKNRQRALVISRPDEQLLASQDREIEAKLDNIRKNMNESELKELQRESEEFKKEMSNELHANFPKLSMKDWKHEKLGVDTKIEDFAGAKILHHNLNANGLTQIALAFDIALLPADVLPAVAVYNLLFNKLDSSTKSNEDLFLEQSRIFGRPIHTKISVLSKYRNDGNVARFVVTVDGFRDSIREQTLDILSENLFGIDYNGQENKIKGIIEREVQNLEITARKDGYYIFSNFSPRFALSSQLKKEGYYLYLKNLLADWPRGYRRLLNELQYLKENLFVRDNLVVDIVGDEKIVEATKNYIAKNLTYKAKEQQSYNFTVKKLNQARIVPARNYGNHLICEATIDGWIVNFLPKFIDYQYLFPEARTKGGAYGSRLHVEPDIMLFYDYSNPNILDTFEIYKNTGNFLRNFKISDEDFDGVRIKALVKYVYPKTSFEKGMEAMNNYLIGRTDSDIRNEYEHIKNLEQEDVRKLSSLINKCLEHYNIATIGAKEGINENMGLYDEVK
ncbi:MAG: insulinase family protein [Rickettsiales bacterium]|jgi:Zn-dependent M16 (insulinase) family peptidase|nr:insulinase family protein [Rickettsiales bacterium]